VSAASPSCRSGWGHCLGRVGPTPWTLDKGELRVVGSGLACAGDHVRRLVDPGDVFRPLGKLPCQQPVPAANVEGIAAPLGNRPEDARVPGNVGVPVRLRGGLAHRIIVEAGHGLPSAHRRIRRPDGES
jgi:hypothetical protein